MQILSLVFLAHVFLYVFFIHHHLGKGMVAARVEGNTSGLKPSELKALNRLAQRRYSPQGGYSTEQARELAALSRLLSRQIGLVLDRQGKVSMVIVGDTRAAPPI